MSEWQPLSEIWDFYKDSIDDAADKGYLDDPELMEDYVWPYDLDIGSMEKDDVRKYVHERMTEIVERVKKDKGVDPNVIAGMIFRSVVCGMMWEKERIGR
jgi:hypothetical protein